MASAAQGAEDAAAGSPAKGGGKGKLLLVGLPLLLLAGAGGAYFAGLLPVGAAKEAKSEEHEVEPSAKASTAAKIGALRPLDPFIANLADEDIDRYIKTTIQVEFLTPEVPPVFEQRLPHVRDLILTLLTNRSFEDIRTPDGKERLREDVIDRINHAVGSEVVRAVYFTEFIVQ